MKTVAALAFLLLASVSAQADDRFPRRAEVIAMIEAGLVPAEGREFAYGHPEVERLVFTILPIVLHDAPQPAATPLVRLAARAIDDAPHVQSMRVDANFLERVEVETALAQSEAALGQADLAFHRLSRLDAALGSLALNPDMDVFDLADAYLGLMKGAIEAGDIPVARRAAEAGLHFARDDEEGRWLLPNFIEALPALGLSLRASWESEQSALRFEADDAAPDDEAWFDLAATAAVTEGAVGQAAAIAWAEQAVESPDWREEFYEGVAARLVALDRRAEARPFLLHALRLELEAAEGYRNIPGMNHIAGLAARAGACDLARPAADLAGLWVRIGDLEAALGDATARRAALRQGKSIRQVHEEDADGQLVLIHIGHQVAAGRTQEDDRLRVGLYCGAADEFAREYLAHYMRTPQRLRFAARTFQALESEGGRDIRPTQRAALGRALPASGLLTLPPTENAWERAGRLSFLAYAALALREAGDHAAADRALRDAWALLDRVDTYYRLESLAWLALATPD